MRTILIFIGSIFLLGGFTGLRVSKPRDSMSSWIKLSGSDGRDICVNDKGEFYLVNTANKLYVYEGPKWKELPRYSGVKIYAANKGLIVWQTGSELRWTDCIKRGNSTIAYGNVEYAYHKDIPDIAIGTDSTVWKIDPYINRVAVTKCAAPRGTVPGKVSRIAAGGAGVWMIDNQGKIFRLKDRIHLNMGWEQMPGGDARDIALSNDGYVFIVDNKGRIYQWTGFRWDQLDGSDGLRIAANNRKLLLINTQREMYTRNY